MPYYHMAGFIPFIGFFKIMIMLAFLVWLVFLGLAYQNVTNIIKPRSNWLGDTTNLGSPTFLQNFTQVPFFIGNSKPVHQMDATWNYTALIPKPDANGLIHGWPAESYEAIGPALDYF